MYKILSHTADLKIIFKGKNLKQLIDSVMEFYFNNISARIDKENLKSSEKIINIEDESFEFIVVRLINELIFFKELSLFIKDYKIIDISNNFLKIKFYLIESKDIYFIEDLKSATYHNLKMKRNKEGVFEIEVVIDL